MIIDLLDHLPCLHTRELNPVGDGTLACPDCGATTAARPPFYIHAAIGRRRVGGIYGRSGFAAEQVIAIEPRAFTGNRNGYQWGLWGLWVRTFPAGKLRFHATARHIDDETIYDPRHEPTITWSRTGHQLTVSCLTERGDTLWDFSLYRHADGSRVGLTTTQDTDDLTPVLHTLPGLFTALKNQRPVTLDQSIALLSEFGITEAPAATPDRPGPLARVRAALHRHLTRTH
ncbi:hypothetical protein ACWDUL_38370 [Nocardia niigatensis]